MEIKRPNELRVKEKSDAEAREKELAESKRIEDEENQEKERINNLLCSADNLYFEIETRHEALKGKCELETRHEALKGKWEINITKLNDYEIW